MGSMENPDDPSGECLNNACQAPFYGGCGPNRVCISHESGFPECGDCLPGYVEGADDGNCYFLGMNDDLVLWT